MSHCIQVSIENHDCCNDLLILDDLMTM